MARFTYHCPHCIKDFQKSLEQRQSTYDCPICGLPSPNIMKIGSACAYDHLDNGAMARAIDRPADVEEMMESHADAGAPPPPQPDEDPEA